MRRMLPCRVGLQRSAPRDRPALQARAGSATPRVVDSPGEALRTGTSAAPGPRCPPKREDVNDQWKKAMQALPWPLKNTMPQGQGHIAKRAFAPEGALQKRGSASKKCIEYEPFGSLLPGRNYSSNSYNFGFNGQEKDDEVFGSAGTSMTAEFWQYDSRIGRRWNIDPVVDPAESPYATNNNNPILYSDPTGACPTGDCDTYKTPADRRVSIDKSSSVWGNESGQLTSFLTGGDTPSMFNWDGDKGGYYNGDGEQYSEGSYADGFASSFDPSLERSNNLTEWWKQAPVEHTAEMLGDFASEVTSKQFWNNTAEYWTSSSYQMGRWDGLSATGTVEGLPIMVFTAGFTAMAAPALSVPSAALTDADGFLIGPIVARAPFNIPVQRFGSIGTWPQAWGLRVGTNRTLNRYGSAILPEWGNPMTEYTLGVIPRGTPMAFGIAGPQRGLYLGGLPQINVNSSLVIPELRLSLSPVPRR